jgi:hypothetical protein
MARLQLHSLGQSEKCESARKELAQVQNAIFNLKVRSHYVSQWIFGLRYGALDLIQIECFLNCWNDLENDYN